MLHRKLAAYVDPAKCAFETYRRSSLKQNATGVVALSRGKDVTRFQVEHRFKTIAQVFNASEAPSILVVSSVRRHRDRRAAGWRAIHHISQTAVQRAVHCHAALRMRHTCTKN